MLLSCYAIYVHYAIMNGMRMDDANLIYQVSLSREKIHKYCAFIYLHIFIHFDLFLCCFVAQGQTLFFVIQNSQQIGQGANKMKHL
jgi:hypothetical protein